MLLLFGGTPAIAQLQADFIPDKTGGCSPLAVSFTNTTIGASANTSYTWEFGNGNTSVIKNSAAIFYTEKTYTVTLTVKDGTRTSVKTKTITVYQKPGIDFTVSSNKDCLPFTPSFNVISSGGAPVSSCYWDFGDGATQQSNGTQVSHTYNFQQTASVTLTATSTYGCTNTITKTDLLKVLPATQAGFSTDKNIYCAITDEVRFNNNSSGPGTISYEWDFGDGATSTIKNPTHIYNQKGNQSVKLTVTSSEGCSRTAKSIINIANYKSDFQVPPLPCRNNSLAFNNTSSPTPDQSTWLFDGADPYTNYYGGAANYSFTTTGIHTVQLTNIFGTCQETITKQVDIKPIPELQGFIADVQGLCGSPVKVNFRDTTTGAVKWLWKFGDNGRSSDLQAPDYTYTNDYYYQVSLTVSNPAGCSSTVSQNVYISKPLVGIWPVGSILGCDSLKMNFTTRSTEEITKFTWDFGDGTATSAEKEPEHIYRNPGTYTAKLTYTTVNGCTGVASYNDITVRKSPLAAFSVPATVCGNTPVYFSNETTGYVTNYTWDFGDGQTSWDGLHKYETEGVYTVKLIAYSELCNDTIEKQNVIKVFPPFPKIGSILHTCEGTRATITFIDGTKQAESYKWDFGDGQTISYTTPVAEIKHAYARSGKYKVVLTTTNAGCTVKDSASAYVLLKQQPVLTTAVQTICLGNSQAIQISNLERPVVPDPYNLSYYYPYTYSFQHPDGSYFNGYVSGADLNSLPWSSTLSILTRGQEDFRVVTTSNPYFGCNDTSNIVSVKVKGPSAGLKILSNNICFKTSASFQDISEAGYNVRIVKWEWDFGDGTTDIRSQSGIVSHIYTNPGNYFVTLKVTDADGCSSASAYYANIIQVTGPKASFTPSGTDVPLNTTVSFYNYTNTYNSYNTAYKWDFGDGTTSTDYSPDHTYTIAGTYTIRLIATNPLNQCGDTVSQVITVKNFNSAFSTRASFIGNNGRCAPALVNFTNTSSNYVRIVWDFGDGFTLENQNYPSHIYKDPGTYIVTLFVYGFNGLTGTYKDTVAISSSTATIKTDVTEGCKGLQVKLNAPVHTNTTYYSWDFGDGNVINTADSFAVNKYTNAGTYSASLITTDVNGCLNAVPLSDKIIIRPDPVVNITPVNPVLCKGNSVQLQVSGGVSYSWSPPDGLSNTAISSPGASPLNTTTYTVNAKDHIGCAGSGTVTIMVAQPFSIRTNPDASICEGSSLQLNTTGADSYKWINEINGLSNTQTGNPIASPSVTTNYSVVGYDQYQCFTDTGFVKITVYPLPVVNAGPDIETITGSEVQLNAISGNDVIKWTWSPAEYLSCTDCASTISKPRSPIEYTITVQNQYNCTAKDYVKINVVCSGGHVYIPSAFSPNGDGKNDRFVILGNGVRIVKSLRIYNRWGNLIFERKNFYPDDNSAAWDGTYKGENVPVGAYVFFAEMECNANETFTRKGTITLVR
ncbi:MAG: PKD domain-containing protein [Bacteroidota bacterium]